MAKGILAKTVFLAAASAAATMAWGQDPPAKDKRPAFECRFAEQAITVDGRANEPDWKAAQVIDDFRAPWKKDGRTEVRRGTRARLLWDRENLYFFAEMDDSDLFADITEHDGRTWHNDVFELFFKPADDKPGYYEFQVNAAGTELDIFFPQREAQGYEKHARTDEFHMESRVALRGTLNQREDEDQGWSVEGRIPWRDFAKTGGRPDAGESWKFSLSRYDYARDLEQPELSTCAPLTVPSFHAYEDFATLTFLGPQKKESRRRGAPDRFVAADTSRLAGSPEPPLPFRVEAALPELKLSYPIFAVSEPEGGRLLLIDQEQSYGKSRIARTRHAVRDGRIESGELDTLLEVDGVAYSLAFHPQYAHNHYVYVGWNGPLAGKPKKTIVTRYTFDPRDSRIDPATALTIIEFESDGHNGAAIAFGLDGMLYVTSGDGTSDSDTNVKGQGLDHLLSKLLRLDVDHPAPGQAYAIPADNPFVGLENARGETWAYGFRNPWRIAVDSQTGHIWVGNNGQDLWEQAFLVERGANYGWSVFEGSHPFYPQRALGPTPHTLPTCEHPHSEARSLTGGVVYYGERFPELRGAYIYGDYSTGKIWGVKHDGRQKLWHKELADTTLQITCFSLDPAGELLILDHRGEGGGGFYTLAPTPPASEAPPFPRLLSQTGLFASTAGHVVEPSLIPYSVNAPLWSDGAHKERFLALPEAAKIEFTNSRGWHLPDQTVLVKSFALETVAGDPSSRRWVETRLLVKQQGEWVGYSYAWNDEQTDAELVAKEGLDRQYPVRQETGDQRQDWRFPSRTECMVCHSRAANYVLGLTTLQYNKEHDYGDQRENQLRVLERLGLLRVNWLAETSAALRQELAATGESADRITEAVERLNPASGQRTAGVSSLLAQAPEKLPRMVDPYDATADLHLRARSYLHANCSQCHVEAGGGNAQIDLEFATAPEKMKLLDASPVHHSFGIENGRLVAPGDPDRSILLHRVSMRKAGQMPQLATFVVDEAAVAMLREWIQSLPATQP